MNSTVYAVDEYGNEAEDVRSGYVGEIKMFGFSGVPAHCLACDGSLLSIAAYPELYAKLGTQHGGDGVTTFALPTAEDVIYAAGNVRAVGAAVADGLPNIAGGVGMHGGETGTFFNELEGLFDSSQFVLDNIFKTLNPSFSPGLPQQTGSSSVERLVLDASKANPIYGASTHVQPKGTAFNFCIVYE